MKTKHLLTVLFAACLGQITFAGSGGLTFYSITKGTYYHQDPGSPPALRPYKPWYFEAKMLFTNAPGAFVSASFLPPGALFGSPLFSPAYDSITREDSQAGLNAAYASGTYRYSFYINSPPSVTVSNVLAAGSFPAAPAIANLADAQAVNPTNDFTLAWSPFTGGRTNDLVVCTLQSGAGIAFQTSSLPGATNALNGTATTVVIPANTLKPGHSYVGQLIFATVQSTVTNQSPGAFGATLYVSRSDFCLKTTGAGDPTPPRLISSFPADGSTGVPTNIPVVLTFDKPMSRNWAIFWTGGTATNWADGFDPGMQRFALTPSLDFRPNQTDAILLNGLNNQLLFADTNSNLLAPDTLITFSTGNGHYDPGTPRLTTPRPGLNGGLQLDLLGVTNSTCVLLASTNLINWCPVMTNAPFAGTVNFNGLNATNPSGFYRTAGY